jgi:hypothetical protein
MHSDPPSYMLDGLEITISRGADGLLHCILPTNVCTFSASSRTYYCSHLKGKHDLTPVSRKALLVLICHKCNILTITNGPTNN